MLREQSPLAGKTVKIRKGKFKGQEYRVEDWWENVGGISWMDAKGNPACLQYAMRGGFEGLPTDNEVLYGKIGILGHLIHISEIQSK